MCTRCGKLNASIGSLISLHLIKPRLLTLTNMRRFIMTLREVDNLVLFTFEGGWAGDIFIHKSIATMVEIFADHAKIIIRRICEIRIKKLEF